MQGVRDKAKYCMRCGEALLPGADRCRGCDCKVTRQSADMPRKKAGRSQCDFRAGPRRCPLATTEGVANGGARLCIYHRRSADNPAAGIRILDDIDRHGPPKPRGWVDSLIDRRIDQQGLHKRPGETSAAFIVRCKAAMPAGADRQMPAKLDLSINRPRSRRPSKAEQIEGLTDRFADHVARLTADGMDTVAAERTALAAMAEELIPVDADRRPPA